MTYLDLSTRRTETAPLSATLSSFIMAGLQRLPCLAELNLRGRPVAEHGGLWPLTCLAPTLTALTISGIHLLHDQPDMDCSMHLQCGSMDDHHHCHVLR